MDIKELAFAGRSLRKSPVFALTAALTIALGIGASTAIFSVMNAVLLRPLPYRDPGQLVIPCAEMQVRNVRDFPYSNADFIDLKEGTRNVFEDMAGVFTFRNLMPAADGTPEQVHVALVTTNFFRMMGAKIELGRDFSESDGIPQAAPPPAGAQAQGGPVPANLPTVAILSHEYFQRRYGGNTSIIGQVISTAGPVKPQVVGVLAPHFELYFPPTANMDVAPDIWLADRLSYDAGQRNTVTIRAVARLKKGVPLERAQAAADIVTAEARKNFLIERTAGYAIRIIPMRRNLVSEVRPAILALMGAVIFLLLIACANVANLLLVRASLRERELAVRAAMGASWWHLARQLLTEAFLLAGLGSLMGVGLAWAGIRELLAIAPANLPRMETIRIDSTVLLFTLIAGIVAGAIFGLASAWRAARPNVMDVLRGSGRNEGLASGGLLRKLVVVAEVALSFVLLIGSGLMFRSFLELQQIKPGFDARQLLVFQLLDAQRRKPEDAIAFSRRIQERLRAIPGVEGVTAATPFPLAGGFNPIRWGTGEALADASKFQATDFQIVLPGYFELMRTPLLEGRTFTDDDNLPGRNVVMIDELLARKAFPHESAVGKRILIRIRTPEAEWVQVIGVVAHQREESLAEPGREQVYFTDAFLAGGNTDFWALRTNGNPASYGSAVREAIREVDPQLLVTRIRTGDELMTEAQAGTRFSLLLIGVFAVIAALLAAIGLYGVLSTVVRQRTSEIGVRMALGAQPVKVFELVVGQGLWLTVIGILAGLAGSVFLTQIMATMLVGVRPTDPITFSAITLLFLLIAMLACWLPARRAARMDPTMALRGE
jgi:putative ABC transport system permease protein